MRIKYQSSIAVALLASSLNMSALAQEVIINGNEPDEAAAPAYQDSWRTPPFNPASQDTAYTPYSTGPGGGFSQGSANPHSSGRDGAAHGYGTYGSGNAYGPSTAQEEPLLLAGDGLKLLISELDEQSGRLAGQLQLGQQPAAGFVMQLTQDRAGRYQGTGQVQTPQGPRPFRAQEVNDETVDVELGGRRFRLHYQ